MTIDGPPGSSPQSFRVAHLLGDVPKNRPDALQRVLADNAGAAQLALITCGGNFDRSYRASDANIVAFARAP